jgi:hypothetical protein
VAVALSGIPASAITNGSPDGTLHPNVGGLIVRVQFEDIDVTFLVCSGSLIAPTVFLTAGHCNPALFPPEWQTTLVGVTFDPAYTANSTIVPPVPGTAFVGHPDYVDADWPLTPDIGVVHLNPDSPLNITPVELPELGLITEIMSEPGFRRQRLTAVGYGQAGVAHGGGPPQEIYPDLRKNAAVWLRAGQQESELEDDYVFHTFHPGGPGGGGGGACYGDSGGPIFLGGNSSNLQIGVTSGGGGVGPNDALCRNPNWAFRLDTATAQSFLCGQGVADACGEADVTQRVQAKDPTKVAKAKALKQKKMKAKKAKAKKRQQLKRQRDRDRRGHQPRQR